MENMTVIGWILLSVLLIVVAHLFFVEHWYIALAVVALTVVSYAVFISVRKSSDNKKKKREEQELNALKQEEADIRERLYDSDAAKFLIRQYRAKAIESLEHFRSLALNAPHNKQYVSGKIEVNASTWGIDGVSFEDDLRISGPDSNLEASALAYIVAKEMLEELEKFRGTQGVSISEEVQQAGITKLEDRDKCRKAYISVSVENPDYVEISDWKNK